MAQKIHIEPADYIPEELRKKYGLGGKEHDNYNTLSGYRRHYL